MSSKDVTQSSRRLLFALLLNRRLWIVPLVWSLILIALNQHDYLTFHFFAEIFPIALSVIMLSAIWWMRKFKENAFLLFIAGGYIWIAGLDIAHILTSDGMNLFIEGNTNLATQFWIGARYLEALLLLAAPVATAKARTGHLLLTAFGVIASGFAILVLSGNFLTTYIEGVGLTDFKIYSEYLIITILAAALVSLWKLNRSINPKEKILIATAIVFTMCAELSFTVYVEIHDISVLSGHIFKSFSYWLIFQAIVVYNLKAPLTELSEFRNTLDSVIDGVMIFDAESLEITYVNKNVATRAGKSIASIVGQTPDFVIANFDVAEFRELSNPLVYGKKKSITYKTTYANEVGNPVSREITLQLMDADNATPRFISISRELDARKQMKLAQAELEFQKLALDEHAIVSVANAKGEITYVNDKLSTISGFTREELIGRNHNILRSAEHPEEFYQDMWQTISDGRPWHGEIMNRKKNGGHYWVLSTIFPQLGEDGKPVSYIGIRTDITERKDAEKEIQKFKKTLDLGKDAVNMMWVDTLEHDYVNNAGAELLRKDREAIIGEKAKLVNLSFDEERFRILAKPLVAGDVESFSYEAFVERADGTRSYLDLIVQLLKVDGERDRFVSTARDITERKKAEKEAQESKEILDFSDDGAIVVWADTLEIVYVNNTMVNWFSRSAEALIGLTVPEANPSFDTPRFEILKSKLLANEVSSVTYESIFVRSDGSEFPIETMIQAFRGETERPRFVAISRDITKRRKDDHKIRQLQVSLDSIADPVCMFWLDNLEYFYANKATSDFCGFSNEELMGHSPQELFKEFDQTEFNQRYAQLFSGELSSITFELYQYDKYGNLREFEVLAQKIAVDGERPHIVEIFRDISERKKVEQAKSEFISTVSHELRTPLTSIKGVLGLIKAGAFDGAPEKLLPMVDIAYENSGRLEALIDDILDVEKISAGGMEFEPKPINVSMFIEEALEANRVYGDKHEIEFVVNAVEDRLIINGDKGRLMQVMANLLSNAAKFSPAGSKVKISAARQSRNACICITDYGSGIPEAAQATIFERFTQADSSDQREKGGTGLGLSISKTIVEGHGGTIWFETEVGEGTTFHIELPTATTPKRDEGQ